jgi:hypothetical protein
MQDRAGGQQSVTHVRCVGCSRRAVQGTGGEEPGRRRGDGQRSTAVGLTRTPSRSRLAAWRCCRPSSSRGCTAAWRSRCAWRAPQHHTSDSRSPQTHADPLLAARAPSKRILSPAPAHVFTRTGLQASQPTTNQPQHHCSPAHDVCQAVAAAHHGQRDQARGVVAPRQQRGRNEHNHIEGGALRRQGFDQGCRPGF